MPLPSALHILQVTWAKWAGVTAPSSPRAKDQREAGLKIYSWVLLFLWCFTFPARQDEKQIPPKYYERGYSWSVYSPASVENVWPSPKKADSHCVSKPISELLGTYPNRIWTFWSLLISVYKGLLLEWVKGGQLRAGVWWGTRAVKYWWALLVL